jgi:cyclic di-GMP phosphodiesterase
MDGTRNANLLEVDLTKNFMGLSDSLGAPSGRIFIVDDDPEIRKLLKRLLTPAGYSVEEFGLAMPALERVRAEPPDLVLLDLNLPDRIGHEILEEIRSDPATRLLPVVMLTGQATREEKIRATRAGVSDFLAKPFSAEELLPRVRSLVMMKHFADEHEHAEHVILMLARTIDARDAYTAGHSGRVAEYADRIAQRMNLDAAARIDMRRGALFHDLGKIVIPDQILRKPGRLTDEERVSIEQHPVVGYELLSPMKTMRKILPVVYSHHERLDGSGYPEGISGSEIPMTVRIVTVADVFDALTSDRAYREALRLDTAFEVLSEGVSKGFWDSQVVEELRGAVSEAGVIGTGATRSD